MHEAVTVRYIELPMKLDRAVVFAFFLDERVISQRLPVFVEYSAVRGHPRRVHRIQHNRQN